MKKNSVLNKQMQFKGSKINSSLWTSESVIYMKKNIVPLFIISLFISIGFGSTTPAEGSGDHSMLVNTTWLAEHLDDPSLIIFHVGKKEEYDEKHIPGAHLFPVMEIFQSPGDLNHEMPEVEKLEKAFSPFGINKQSIIVLYYSEEWLTVAARAYLTLDHISLGAQTSLLDGGLAQWENEERATTEEVPQTLVAELKLKINEEILTNINWLKENLRNPDVVLIDGRPEEFYDGSEKAEHIEKYGHIEGAISIPFPEITLEKSAYKLKSKKKLQKLFDDAGIKEGSTIVAYCNTGVWAALDYFVAKYLGYNARFFDGSFEEWIKDDSSPITEPVSIKN